MIHTGWLFYRRTQTHSSYQKLYNMNVRLGGDFFLHNYTRYYETLLLQFFIIIILYVVYFFENRKTTYIFNFILPIGL